LDGYAETHALDAMQMIGGMEFDPRVSNHCNKPSFGYCGNCFAKDTKQLLTNFENFPNNMVPAIVDVDTTRNHFIANVIIKRNPKVVGAYRLVIKSGSGNFRASAIQGLRSE
jgi:UDPglucose 6-dehydrogenase